MDTTDGDEEKMRNEALSAHAQVCRVDKMTPEEIWKKASKKKKKSKPNPYGFD